jgi:hypothetical protein
MQTSFIPTPQNCSLQDNYENICAARQATGHGVKNIRHAWPVSKAKRGVD